MAQTLFYVPASVAGLPMFGFGILLVALLVIGGATLLWQARSGWSAEASNTLVLLAMLCAAVYFLLPGMVEMNAEGDPVGVPLRGFGLMLMLATIAGVGISAWRARQVGLDPEIIYSLAFYMFLGGILGARGFYVIQYWHEYFKPGMSLADSLKDIVNAAKGGLVVYGSFIGGLAAGGWFIYQRKLPLFAVADIIAPGMALGQSIGRIGCFLNGCCYGGLCALPLVATPFPESSNPVTHDLSPPYARQKELGWLHGFELAASTTSGDEEQLIVSQLDTKQSRRRCRTEGWRSDCRHQWDRPRLGRHHAAAYAKQRLEADRLPATSSAAPAPCLPVRGQKSPCNLPMEQRGVDDGFPSGRACPFIRHSYTRLSMPACSPCSCGIISRSAAAMGEVFALLVTLHPISRLLPEADPHG